MQSTRVLDESKKLFRDNSPFWAMCLIRVLDDAKHGTAYLWVRRCVGRLLPLFDSDNVPELMSDLERLDRLANNPPTHDSLVEQSREIWYRNFARDEVQTAVSKLYEGFTAQYYATDKRYTRSLSAPLDNLLSDWSSASQWHERADEFHTVMIDEFEAIAEEFGIAI